MASIYNAYNYIANKAQSAADTWSNFTNNIFNNLFTAGDAIQKEIFDEIIGRIPLVGQPATRLKNNLYSRLYAYYLARNPNASPKLLEYFNSTYGDKFNEQFFKYLEDYNNTHLYKSQYDWYKYQLSRPKLPSSAYPYANMLLSGNYSQFADQLIDDLSDYIDPVEGINYVSNRISTGLNQPRKASNLRGGLRNHTTPIYNYFTDYFKSTLNSPISNSTQVIAPNIPIPMNNTIVPNTIANDNTKFNSFLNQLNINNNIKKIINSNMDTTPNQPFFFQDVIPYTYNSVRSWFKDIPDFSYYNPLNNRQKRRLLYKYGLNKINSNKNNNNSMVIYGRNKFPLRTLLNRRRQRARRNQMRRYKTINSSDSYVFDCYKTYLSGINGSEFNQTYSIRNLLASCVLWPQTASLYNQFKVTFFTLEIRQLLSYRYFLNQPVLAVNCLYNANDASNFDYEDLRSSTGSMVYHMEKNYFVYKHRFQFTSSPSGGLGKFTDLSKAQTSTYIDPNDADTWVFLRSNIPLKLDLTGLPNSTTDDLENTPVFELHFKFWVKLKGKMQ